MQNGFAAEGAIIAVSFSVVHSDCTRAAMAEESRMARMDAVGPASNVNGVSGTNQTVCMLKAKPEIGKKNDQKA